MAGATPVEPEGTVDLRVLARALAPASTSFSAPSPPPGTVRRTASRARLDERPGAPCLFVSAPVGYGKSTLLTTIAERDDRPCAWLALGRGDDDPTALLARVLLALDSIEPVPNDAFTGILLSDADLVTVRLPRLAELLANRSQQLLLVLDDAHQVGSRESCEVLQVLVDHMPGGSCVAIATRDATSLSLGRARAGGRVHDIRTEDLEMTLDEATQLMHAAGLEVGPDDAALLVERTERWPAGLYLSALVLRGAAPATIRSISGSARPFAEYLVEQVLAPSTTEHVAFMLRTSILDRLTGPVCDAVLDRTDSADVLEALAAANRMVVPVSPEGSYRYHHLLQDLLRAELGRHHRHEIADLHHRASAWFEAHGNHDEAVHHAHESGDKQLLVDLVWRHATLYLATGRTATVDRWLEPLEPAEVAAQPALAITAGWCCFTGGDVDELSAWLAFAEGGADDVLPDGVPVEAAVALLRALVGRDGFSSMRADAATAFRLDRVDSPYRAVASFLEGAAAYLLDDVGDARRCLQRAAAMGELIAPSPNVHARGLLALIASDEDRLDEATMLVDGAIRSANELCLEERPESSLVYGIGALVAARTGSAREARERSKHAGWLLSNLKGAAPWITTLSLLGLTRAHLFLGDLPAAQRSANEAARALAEHPDAGVLPDRLAEVQRLVATAEHPLGLSATPITGAELRVLRYLPTHLSFAEIAAELYVSRNTVKTQAIAVYRKLEVSSRGEAVERAIALGLLEQRPS